MDARAAEVRRLLDRYLIEVVEAYDLCPWAKSARLAGEIGVDILWDTPAAEDFVAAARTLLAVNSTRVAMVVAPELAADPAALRAIRGRGAALDPAAGLAHFHPAGTPHPRTPAPPVPFPRRSAGPMLQPLPLGVADRVRAAPAIGERGEEA